MVGRRALLACAALLATSPAVAQQYSGYQPGPGPQPSTSGGGGGSGTVTSAGLALPSSLFAVTGSPVTTSGTLTGTLKTQFPNIVWAGPTTGSAAAPTFRALVGADLPNPGASSLGGIQSLAATTHQWINSISTSGVPGASQPACADLSNAGVFCPASAGTGVITAVGVNVGSAGAVVVNGGAGGTPNSLTLTNATGLPLAGLNGLGAGVATLLGGTSSGMGGPAGTTSPSFTTPAIGAATGTSLALGGATLGTNALAVTGSVAISGQTVSEAGSATVPGYTFVGDTTTGIALVSNGVSIVSAGSSAARISSSGLRMISTAGIGWVTGTDPSVAFTTELLQDASNTLAQRNGTNAQAFRVYNTFTDASNYERGQFSWSSSILKIGTDASGTGSARAVELTIGGTSDWRWTTSGHYVAVTDNTFDIGASGATRPRTGYFGTSVQTPAEVGTGTSPTATGSCAITTKLGGNTVGSFVASGACVAGTVILTFALTAPTGWTCNTHDTLTPGDAMNLTAYTTTTATLTGTMANSDLVTFDCRGF